jgi:hypothetical protein
MIKFLAEREGRPMIGLGLSRDNCEKLLAGKPIFIDMKVMLMNVAVLPDLNEATILIFGGETEESMQIELLRAGPLPKAQSHYEEN